jgi:hypothetical protein
MSLHCKRYRRKRAIRHCRRQSVFEFMSCSRLGDGGWRFTICWKKIEDIAVQLEINLAGYFKLQACTPPSSEYRIPPTVTARGWS